MNSTSKMTYSRLACLVWVAAILFGYPACGQADDASGSGFALRNQNPFLQIYGLPPFASADLADRGRSAWDLSLDLVNHADAGISGTENFSIDGETYFLTISMRRRVTDWLELGFDVPFVSHADGFMDNMIKGWHDFLGISNSKRKGTSNELEFLYQQDGQDLYRLSSPVSGVGDVQLTAAIPLRDGAGGQSRIAIRSSIKLPTGDSDTLLGSGATDFAIGLYTTGTTSLLGQELELTGFAGGLFPGRGDVLPEQQRDVVAFGGVGAGWPVAASFTLAVQLYAQSRYFDSGVEELGGNSIQLAFGGIYRTRRNTSLRLAVVEDVAANTSPDFALHFSVRVGGG